MISLTVLLSALLPRTLYAQLIDRAPDVYPGTLPEMRTPEYWIGRMAKPDEVLISPDGIEKMNDEYRALERSPGFPRNIPEIRTSALISWWPGYLPVPHDIDALAPAARSDSVKSWIAAQTRYLRRGRFGNAAGIRYAARDLDRIEGEMAAESMPRTIDVREGIAVRRTRLRIVPSRFPVEQGICDSALSVSGKIIPISVHWDLWNSGVLSMGEPVRVLHGSRSGAFLFLVSGNRFGWVASEDIAFGGRKEIGECSNPRRFVVCTGDRVPLYSDPECTVSSGWFGMGDRLPLDDLSHPRKVLIPLRHLDGSLGTGAAWLAMDADVHAGWLPCTRGNIVRTALKLLDSPYDWTGAWFGRDHITTYRDIFSVFGFDLPRHDALFHLFGKDRAALEPVAGKDAQFRGILGHEPFVTIMSCGGHAKLLMGEIDGRPIVFDHYGHGYVDATGNYVELCRSYIGTMDLPAYFLTRPITFLELK